MFVGKVAKGKERGAWLTLISRCLVCVWLLELDGSYRPRTTLALIAI